MRFNQKLLFIVAALSTAILLSLGAATSRSGNLPGFFWSVFDVLIVSVGTYLALRIKD